MTGTSDIAVTSWDFWSVIALMGIGQALIFLMFLLTKKRYKSKAAVLIVLLLLWVIWVQCEFLSVRTSWVVDLSLFYATRHGIWLALGSLLWHYTRLSVSGSAQFSKSVWLHYFPFFLFVILVPLIVTEPVPYRGVHYGMLTLVKFPKIGEPVVQMLYGILYFVQFLHTIFYLTISYSGVIRYQKQLKEEISSMDKIRLIWLKNVIICFFVVMVMVIAFLVLFLFTDWYSREMDYLYILPITVVIYIFSAFALNEPSLFQAHTSHPAPASRKYGITGLTSPEVESWKQKLLNHLENEKPFLDPELRLQTLAKQLDIQPYQLSQVINEGLAKSFFDLINEYRVMESVRLMKSGRDSDNILAIAFASGFNNKVSFNRYFKKYTGKTPTAYQKKQE